MGKNFCMLFLSLCTLMTVSGCSDDDATTSSTTTALPTFSADLEELLPKGESSGDADRRRAARITTKDSYSSTAESYADAIGYGGMIDRSLGQDDPLTIWMNLDLAETFGTLITDGTVPATAESTTLTLPFAIDGAADTLAVDYTFDSGDETVEYNSASESIFCDLTEIKGGFTDTALMLTFNAACYEDEARETISNDSRFILYANKASGDDGLVLKAVRFENEGGIAERISSAIFSFNENRSGDYIKYRVLSNYSWDKDTANGDLNMIQSTIMSGTKEKFLIRKRSMNNCNDGVDGIDCESSGYGNFADQFFAVDFDATAGTFGASAPAAASSDGTSGQTGLIFTSADTAGLGNVINASDDGAFTTSDYATILALDYGDFDFIASTNMFNLNDAATLLPQSRTDLDTDW